MKRQRVILWSITAVLVIAAVAYRVTAFREPVPPPTPKIAFVAGGSEPYWQLTAEGAKAAARKEKVDLQIEMPTEDENVEQQNAILQNLNLNSVDAIALSPLDAEGQTDLINQLVRAGKKVMTFDSDAPLSIRQSHIGTSNFVAGRMCAGIVNEALPQGGKIAVLVANLSKENVLDRRSGFQERISQYADDVAEGDPLKFQVVGYFADNGNAKQCETNIRDVIAEHPDLSCIVGMNAMHGGILVRVLKELDRLGKISLVTFDAAEETLRGVEDGHIYATLAQDPYRFGYESVETLASLCRGDETGVPIVGKGSTYVSAEAIRQENLEEFRTRLRSRQLSPAKSKGEKSV